MRGHSEYNFGHGACRDQIPFAWANYRRSDGPTNHHGPHHHHQHHGPDFWSMFMGPRGFGPWHRHSPCGRRQSPGFGPCNVRERFNMHGPCQCAGPEPNDKDGNTTDAQNPCEDSSVRCDKRNYSGIGCKRVYRSCEKRCRCDRDKSNPRTDRSDEEVNDTDGHGPCEGHCKRGHQMWTRYGRHDPFGKRRGCRRMKSCFSKNLNLESERSDNEDTNAKTSTATVLVQRIVLETEPRPKSV